MGTYRTNENPHWWTAKHDTAWERVKDAFARDWQQTIADFSKRRGVELNQNLADTVKQAFGKEPIPPGQLPNEKNRRDDFESVEPALRFGYAASSYYVEHERWDESLESKLRPEWDRLHTDQDFDTVKEEVRRGWERARKL
jgi:hypothetical protein